MSATWPEITVWERTGTDLVGYPLTAVIPFPLGRYNGERPPLCLFDSTDNPVPVDLEVMTRHRDGSVRHLRIVWVAPILLGGQRHVWTLRQGNPRQSYVDHPEFAPQDLLTSVNGREVSAPAPSELTSFDGRNIEAIWTWAAWTGALHYETLVTRWRGVGFVQADVVLANRNLGSQYLQDPVHVSSWRFRSPFKLHVLWEGSRLPTRVTEEPWLDVLWNHDIHDFSSQHRRLFLFPEGTPAATIRAATLLPPRPVVDPEWRRTSRVGAWPWETFPANHAATPDLRAPRRPPDAVGHAMFWLPEYGARLKRSCTTGGWPYPADRFAATGIPGEADREYAQAVGETTLLAQDVRGYRHATHWSRVRGDEAPYCSGTWRKFGQVRREGSLPARDSQHGWWLHVGGAVLWSGDHMLTSWLASAAHLHVAELMDLTPFPSTSERAIAHSMSLVLQGYMVTGDAVLLDAVRARVRSLERHKNNNRIYGLGYGSFKTGMLMRSLIGFMQEVGPEDADYWIAARYLHKAADWNRTYGNFAYECSTSDALAGKVMRPSITGLTWPDPLAWYCFNFGDRRALSHLRKYMNKSLGGDLPTGDWDTPWSGQYENGYWSTVRDAPPPGSLATAPLLMRTEEGADSAHFTLMLPAGDLRYCIVRARRPIAVDFTPDTSRQNWWSATPVQAGVSITPRLDFSVPRRTDGLPQSLAVLCWDAQGRRSTAVIEYV